MSSFLHILDRSIIHIFSAAAVYLLGFFLLDWAMRRHSQWTLKILPALLGVLVIYLREPFDVAEGQILGKAVTDLVSWIIGMGLAIWGLERFLKARIQLKGE